MNEASIQKRTPRFTRVSRGQVRLQSRDIEIIKYVHKHRFLTSRHILALIPGSERGVLGRLQKLFHGGYLDRPAYQLQPHKKGSDPLVYGLGNKGADTLSWECGIDRSRVDWTQKNRQIKTFYLRHALMVSHFMVCLELACRSVAGVELIEPEEIVKRRPSKTYNPNNPCGWRVVQKRKTDSTVRQINCSVVPDKVFGLFFPEEREGRKNAFFFLEADRSTMPVMRTNFKTTSFFKKMIGYWESWRQDLYTANFGFKNARVLTITKSQERIDSMIAAGKQVDERKQGSKMFLFARRADFILDRPETVFDHVWRNGRDAALASILE